jgi:hypothetical protein
MPVSPGATFHKTTIFNFPNRSIKFHENPFSGFPVITQTDRCGEANRRIFATIFCKQA